MSEEKTEQELDAESFKRVADEVSTLFIKKSQDYGNNWKIGGPEGINWQIFRKFLRIWGNRKNKEMSNESLRDSYIDLIAYSIMRVILLDRNVESDIVEDLLGR